MNIGQHTNIIPWKCHICGRQFDTSGGGTCRKCGRATCDICFGLAKLKMFGKLKMPESRVCRACADKGKETGATAAKLRDE